MMYKTLKLAVNKLIIVCLLVTITGCMFGINSKQNDKYTEFDDEKKLITDIIIEEEDEAINVLIKGNHPLFYTSAKQSSPFGFVLSFPETSPSFGETEYIINNEIIETIKVSELIDDEVSEIGIVLKMNAPYDVVMEDDGIKISFFRMFGGKDEVISEDNIDGISLTEDDSPEASSTIIFDDSKAGVVLEESVRKPLLKQVDGDQASSTIVLDDKKYGVVSKEDMENFAVSGEQFADSEEDSVEKVLVATLIKSIDVKESEKIINISISSDGAITDYKSFILDNPPRIVFDLFNIKSPYNKEQIVQINKEWATYVRHYSHPDKVRVVIDTKSMCLFSYSAKSIPDGLLIGVEPGDGFFDQSAMQLAESESTGDQIVVDNESVGGNVEDTIHDVEEKNDLSETVEEDQEESAEKIIFAGERSADREETALEEIHTATLVESVSVDESEETLNVIITSDGAITDYKSFTLNNPPRIVFDLFNIKSPYNKEQIIQTSKEWATHVRHYSHPDKIRIVVDTRNTHLFFYSAKSIPNGLLIGVEPGDGFSDQSNMKQANLSL